MTVVARFTSSIHSPQTIILIRAVLKNRLLAAKTSIALGANVNVLGYHNDTLLHVCKSTQMATILLNAGARIEATNNFGSTPLHASMRRALIQLSMLFINSGAQVNAPENNGTTPLHLAQSTKINEALLVHGASPNIQNIDGDTPLHVALREKGSPIVKQLVDAGANELVRNFKGHNAQEELDLRIARMNHEINDMTKALRNGPVIIKPSEPETDFTTKLKQASTAVATAGQNTLHKVSSYLPSFGHKTQITPAPKAQEQNKSRTPKLHH